MIFLSHSWSNKSAARKVVEALALEKIPCWFDEQQLPCGAELRPSLISAILESDIFVYLVSAEANSSKWCQDELRYALSREAEGEIFIVPVRLSENEDPMPSLLAGRVSSSLEPTTGGAARLAHSLAIIDGHDNIPDTSSLSATLRLEQHRIVHTLFQARCNDSSHDFSFLLIDDDYEALDELYWTVAEVRFPDVSARPKELSDALEFVDKLHDQSRRIIKEAREICHKFVTQAAEDHADRSYYDAAYERALHVILHRLQWNTRYLQKLRDREGFDSEFLKKKNLAEPFNSHRCDFVENGKFLGAVNVPRHGHPYYGPVANIRPWGLTRPFTDLLEYEVGTAIGEILALRFISKERLSIAIPNPESLTYGLS